MTMFFDSEIDRIFKGLSNFDGDPANGACCGYTVTVGPDGRPVVQEYGNIKPALDGQNQPAIETIVDEKEKTVKLIAEMPGVEKSDFKVLVDDGIVNIQAQHGEKKYHTRASLEHKVDEDSASATYKNGILQIVFKLADVKETGKRVEVQ